MTIKGPVPGSRICSLSSAISQMNEEHTIRIEVMSYLGVSDVSTYSVARGVAIVLLGVLL